MQKWIVRQHGFVVESRWIDWHKQQLSARTDFARPAECSLVEDLVCGPN